MKLLIAFISSVLFLAAADISDVRKAYPDAASTKAKSNAFHKLLADVPDNDPNKVLVAYKGCAETLLSKHSGVLSGKIKHMKAGAKLLDASVAAEPENVEIRMIRLSVQENVPAIVGYKENIKEDKAAILAGWQKTGTLKEYIKNFMLRSKSFSKEEKDALK